MAIAVQQQTQIDVELSQDGHIVISQYQGQEQMGLSKLVIAPVNLEKLIQALRTAKREALEAKE